MKKAYFASCLTLNKPSYVKLVTGEIKKTSHFVKFFFVAKEHALFLQLIVDCAYNMAFAVYVKPDFLLVRNVQLAVELFH